MFGQTNMKVVDVVTPVSVALIALVAIGATLAIEEAGEEWIHAVWVVLSVALLVDMEPKVRFAKKFRTVARKSVAMMVGLVLGVASGLIVRALHSWDSPRWAILLLRLGTECLLLFIAAIGAQLTPKVSAFELALVCVTSSVALFCPRASLALARVVAVLFACAVVLAVTAMFWLIETKRAGKTKSRFSAVERELIDSTLALCAKVIRIDDMDKEEIEALGTSVKQNAVIDSGLSSHVRPLVFECYSLYWSAVAGAATPFIQPKALFCNTSLQFDRYFRPSLEKIEDGLDGIRSDLALAISDCEAGDLERVTQTVEKITHQWIASNLVEGLQGMEFHFAQTSKTAVFGSHGQRWLMASYLVNLSTLIVSVVGFVGYVFVAIDADVSARDAVTDSLNRLAAIQKLGSLADLLALSAPIVSAHTSRRPSSSAVSPIVHRHHDLSQHSAHSHV